MELCCTGWPDYELIDSGDGLRLERFGAVTLSRQAAQAVWPRTLSEADWKSRAQVSHYRADQGPGSWTHHQSIPERWEVALGDMTMEIHLAPFGHVGFFADQQMHWSWLRSLVETRANARVLNLFAYTGGSTIMAALGGAHVTHVDAAKSSVNGARRNAERSGMGDASVRWIAEDAMRYVERERRRGSKYDLIVLDPPTFGRGPKGQTWKIERDLPTLMQAVSDLLSDDPLAVLLTGHTPGYSAAVLRNLMHPVHRAHGGQMTSGDMVQQATASTHVLPGGVYCRWTAATTG